MQGLISMVLSTVAIAVSGFTTYIQFLNERYTLSAAVADVNASVSTGSYRSGDVATRTFRYFVEPRLILSNRGTRSLIYTGARLVKSSEAERCVASEAVYQPYSAPDMTIIADDTVQMVNFGFNLDTVEADLNHAEPPAAFDTLWCLQMTVFDHRGRRLEPLFPLADIATQFVESEDGDGPVSRLTVDFPREPQAIADSGFF